MGENKLNHTWRFWNIFLKIQNLTEKGNQSYKYRIPGTVCSLKNKYPAQHLFEQQ
jgi:hypothetical protein